MASKLQGAKTQASSVLKDDGLAGSLDKEAAEQRAISEAIACWKVIKDEDVAKTHYGKFLQMMDKLRSFKAVVACLVWTAISYQK